jgi:Secretion system C-terminal sorting domain
LVYGPQVADVSQGRCPDGTGSFSPQTTPSYNALNCGVAAPEASLGDRPAVHAFPNPASDQITVTCATPLKGMLVVTNVHGQVQRVEPWTGRAMLDVGSWSAGIYFLQLGGSTTKVVVAR